MLGSTDSCIRKKKNKKVVGLMNKIVLSKFLTT